jgi:hypothetical protein
MQRGTPVVIFLKTGKAVLIIISRQDGGVGCHVMIEDIQRLESQGPMKGRI